MRWIAFGILLMIACEGKPSAPAAKAGEAEAVPARIAPPVRRTRPRTETRPPTPIAAWARAEASATADDWDAAAEAYVDQLAACTEACEGTSYAVVLARKNALLAAPEDPPPGDEPVAVPPRVQATVDALDAYVAMAAPDDPDAPGMKFLAGHALYRYRQPDAIARLEAQLRDHRADETAEYAANLLLDLLLRSGRVDDARAWATKLLADDAFLTGRDGLRATLERVAGV